MLEIVSLMLGGVLVGYLLRARKMKWISGAISVAIWMLLFSLGIVVGGNEMILNNLTTIGWQALLLSVGGVLGSVIMAGVVYHYFFKKRG